MKYDHFNARVLFVDGPIELRICEAPTQEIVDAYERLFRLVRVAAVQLDEATKERELLDDSSR